MPIPRFRLPTATPALTRSVYTPVSTGEDHVHSQNSFPPCCLQVSTSQLTSFIREVFKMALCQMVNESNQHPGQVRGGKKRKGFCRGSLSLRKILQSPTGQWISLRGSPSWHVIRTPSLLHISQENPSFLGNGLQSNSACSMQLPQARPSKLYLMK